MTKFFGRTRKSKPTAVDSQTAADADDSPSLSETPLGVDPVQLAEFDDDTRALYLDAYTASVDAKVAREKTPPKEFQVRGPFQLGFTVTLGVLVAILAGSIVGQLSTIIMYVVAALFVALGLDPLVRWFEAKGLKRSLGIGIVFGGFVLVIGGLLAVIVPMVGAQVALLVRNAPSLFRDLNRQEWLVNLDKNYGDFIDFDGLLKIGQDFVSKPENWAQVAGGVWQAGIGIGNSLTAAVIVLILTLYFLASLRTIKRAFYSLVARSQRAKVIEITEQVTKSVGGYVNGMALLAVVNSLLGFIVMTILEVPFAGLVAVGVFLLALIPLIGSVLATVLVTFVALFDSPATALFAAAYYLIYMQIEAYLLTPRVMNRVVSVPGSLVVIGALAGGTLLNLLGALIAIPVTAMVLMIIKQVWVPRQELR